MRFGLVSLFIVASLLATSFDAQAQTKPEHSGLEPLPLVPMELAPLLEQMDAEEDARVKAAQEQERQRLAAQPVIQPLAATPPGVARTIITEPSAATARTRSTQTTLTQSGVTQSVLAKPSDGEMRIFEREADAKADVDAALKRARRARKNTMLILGGNWCHDSRALTGYFEGERFATLWDKDYEKVYVDVGRKSRNLDIAARFGMEEVVGTPSVLIISPKGDVLNLESAVHWRNSASMSEDDVFDYFSTFAREARKVR